MGGSIDLQKMLESFDSYDSKTILVAELKARLRKWAPDSYEIETPITTYRQEENIPEETIQVVIPVEDVYDQIKIESNHSR